MIYRWFKRNRPFPNACEVARRAHANRGRKLDSIMNEIAERLDVAGDRGDRTIEYTLAGENTYLLDELIERLRAEKFLVTHEKPDEDTGYYGTNITLSWVPPKGMTR